MKTTLTKWPLALKLKSLFAGKTLRARKPQSSETYAHLRPCSKERAEIFERQINMEIHRAETFELRRAGFLSLTLLLFGPLFFFFPLAAAIGKEVIAL